MKLIKILIVVIEMFSLQCYPQTPAYYQMDLQKYWKYRERLKNFVVPGSTLIDGPGLSSPACSRGANFGPEWSDATDFLGYYIGVLATEYHLLKSIGNTVQLEETKKELFYALDKINSLDCFAELYWQDYNTSAGNSGNPNSPSAPTYGDCSWAYKDLLTGIITYPTMSNSISVNGFFIRDDVPSNFCSAWFNHDLIRNSLNSCLEPLPDYYLAQNVTSAYADHVGAGRGPTEETQDQVIRLMIGWALVCKYVDPSDVYTGHTFNDFTLNGHAVSNFVEEAQSQCYRVVEWFANNGWLIMNPVTQQCTQGVDAMPSCTIGADQGANANGYAYGFARAAYAILENPPFSNTSTGTTTSIFMQDIVAYPTCTAAILMGDWLPIDPVILLPGYLYDCVPCGEGEYVKPYELAAIGRAFDGNTASKLAHHCDIRNCNSTNREHIPLLFDALWGENCHNTGNFSDNYYECLLDNAPCNGISLHDFYQEWDNGNRIYSGTKPSSSWTSSTDECSGTDYMLYFNLYSILNLSSIISSYSYIRPQDICPSYVIKNNYFEHDVKNFLASEYIKAGKYNDPLIDNYDWLNYNPAGDYTISNNYSPAYNGATNVARAQVTFTSGHYIDLLPGFTAEKGVLFNASIDQTLKAMNCVIANPSNNCSGFAPSAKLNPNNNNTDTINKNSISNNNQNKITIYPNPSNGNFEITSKNFIQKVEVKDVLGNTIYTQYMTDPTKTLTINLSFQSKGMYFVKIYSNSDLFNKKIIIE